jgi:hypothetical protein
MREGHLLNSISPVDFEENDESVGAYLQEAMICHESKDHEVWAQPFAQFYWLRNYFNFCN